MSSKGPFICFYKERSVRIACELFVRLGRNRRDKQTWKQLLELDILLLAFISPWQDPHEAPKGS